MTQGALNPTAPHPHGIAYLQTSCYMGINVIKWTPESDYNGSEPHSATEKHMWPWARLSLCASLVK